jgi:uncharacterized protein (TIGR02453 family)
MPQLQVTLDFLRKLAKHNNKTWFDAHRADYEQAKAHFEALLEDLVMRFDPIESLHGMTPRDFMYRINRDVRFSADKSPYKTNFAAVLGRAGRKSMRSAYYLHVQPGESFLGGGVYMPTPEQLKTIRTAIASNPSELQKISAAKDFVKYFGAMAGDKLKTAPKGFAPDHVAAELLKHKQFLVMHAVSEADVTAAGFAKHVIAVFKAMQPFNEYFNRVLGL